MRSLSPRLASLPTIVLGGGISVPIAIGFRARLLGLAGLDAEEAGNGLLIPRCRSVHTIGMRFDLDLVFLDRDGIVVAIRRGLPPGRARVAERAAVAVLELPPRSGHLSRYTGHTPGGE